MGRGAFHVKSVEAGELPDHVLDADCKVVHSGPQLEQIAVLPSEQRWLILGACERGSEFEVPGEEIAPIADQAELRQKGMVNLTDPRVLGFVVHRYSPG